MDGFRIATKYPRIASSYFDSIGVDVEVMKLHGSVELSVRTGGIADAIVDIVETGQTLRENGLVEVAKVMDVSALLLVNRIAQKVLFDEINELVMKLRGGFWMKGGLEEYVREILEDIRRRGGLEALREYSERFDNYSGPFRVSEGGSSRRQRNSCQRRTRG